MTLPNDNMDFSAFDVLPAASLDDLVENIEALQDFSAFDNGTLPAALIDSNATGHGFVLLGSATLGSAGDTISVTPIAARTHLKIIAVTLQSGQIAATLTFNGDTANNYAYRQSANGGVDGTAVSQSKGWIGPTETSDQYHVLEVLNLAAKEKLIHGKSVSFGSAGAGNAPTRMEGGGKWANTSAQITRVDIVNTGSGDFAIGSKLIVLGRN